jgi:hypothetical protein
MLSLEKNYKTVEKKSREKVDTPESQVESEVESEENIDLALDNVQNTASH